ncbi:MAG: tRNA pseudouridine(55) synthase TruB [Gemmatimonadales bacterium]
MLVDKPAGMTSHDVVQRVRRVLGTRAAGHTGTLDPFATGLLVVLLGRATRLARFVETQSKTYLATGRLGIRTDSDDLTGQVVATSDAVDRISEEQLRASLASFLGARPQRPPRYSAKHVGGERSYAKARRGEVVELPEVTVTVRRIELVQYQSPLVTFRAEVSAGTYLRAIARDLGERLGVGAHLTGLRREAIGSIRVEDAVTLDQLSPAAIISARAVVGDLPTVELDQKDRVAVRHGRAVEDSGAAGRPGGGAVVALVAGGELVAVARGQEGWLHPTVVLETP